MRTINTITGSNIPISFMFNEQWISVTPLVKTIYHNFLQYLSTSPCQQQPSPPAWTLHIFFFVLVSSHMFTSDCYSLMFFPHSLFLSHYNYTFIVWFLAWLPFTIFHCLTFINNLSLSDFHTQSLSNFHTQSFITWLSYTIFLA